MNDRSQAAEGAAQRVAREDLVVFVNACFAATGQDEFHEDRRGGQITLDFLHEYILGNYRKLYARTLSAGINHKNVQLVVVSLLAAGAPAGDEDRREEAALVSAALDALPPQRALAVFAELRRRGVNNRRTRATVKGWFARRRDPDFLFVKYRRKVRAAVEHAHVPLAGERAHMLFSGWTKRTYATPLFETFRQAHFSARHVFELPMTVAEGLARKHRIPRDVFLRGIAAQMTANERMRHLEAAKEAHVELAFDLGRAAPTKLAMYLLSMPLEERRARRDELTRALDASVRRALARNPVKLPRVAAVLDRSWSTSGSAQKHLRPLAVALATSALLRAASASYAARWTTPVEDELFVTPVGQTRLAEPLCEVLALRPDVVVIVSDGWENDPPRGVHAVVGGFRAHLDRQHDVSIVHMNPAFSGRDFGVRALSPRVPALGVRDAEDVPTMLGFARFADGTAPLAELERYLAGRAARAHAPILSIAEALETKEELDAEG